MSAQFEAGQGEIALLRKDQWPVLVFFAIHGDFEGKSLGFQEICSLNSGKVEGSGLAATFPLRKRWGGYVVGFFL